MNYKILSLMVVLLLYDVAKPDCRIEHKQTFHTDFLHHHVRYSIRPQNYGEIQADMLYAWDTDTVEGTRDYYPVDFCYAKNIQSVYCYDNGCTILLTNGKVIKAKSWMESAGPIDPMKGFQLRYRRLLP